MGKLTATRVKAIKEPGRYGDGEGLFLLVSKAGSKSWMVRVQRNGRRRDIGLGSASKVSLALARERAVEVRMQVEAGFDPVIERAKAAGIPAFCEAAQQVYEEQKIVGAISSIAPSGLPLSKNMLSRLSAISQWPTSTLRLFGMC